MWKVGCPSECAQIYLASAGGRPAQLCLNGCTVVCKNRTLRFVLLDIFTPLLFPEVQRWFTWILNLEKWFVSTTTIVIVIASFVIVLNLIMPNLRIHTSILTATLSYINITFAEIPETIHYKSKIRKTGKLHKYFGWRSNWSHKPTIIWSIKYNISHAK